VVEWQNNLYLSNALTLTAGLQYQVESGDNTGNFEESLDSRAVYVNSIVKLLKDALVLNAGLRYDDLETAGSKTTYRVGASYTVRGIGLTLKASYGTGFRAPSLNDLFFPFFGNPSLKPEESKSFDAGLIQTFFQDRLSLAVAYFNQKYENLIQADPRTFTAINIANASVKGVEANGSLRLFDGLEIRVGYTYLDTEDEDTGLPLIRRPKNKFSFGIGYAARNLSLLADYVYVGGRFDSTLDARTGNKLPPYSLVNLSGTYTIYKNIALFARVDNLFNKDYEDIRSFGTKGSSIYGGIKVTL
jgi:vitamin B12 transporter